MALKTFEPAPFTNFPTETNSGENLSGAISFSVVIPVYNSEHTIGPLCEALIAALAPRWQLQIVLVDDGSSDASASICRHLHNLFPDIVTCVILSKNFGEHNAVMAGLNFATGDYCVIMDDDFQNPPDAVETLLAKAREGFDVVYVRYVEKKHSLWRNTGSYLHNWMATHALQKPKDLYLSSFKLLSRFVVREVIRYSGPDPYLDAIILRTTRNIGTVTVPHLSREQGQSGYTLRKLLALWSNMIVAFSVYPLRVIGLYGLVTALAGLFYGGYTLLTLALPSLPDATDLDQLNASMWFFRGSILLVISIIGEYVGRIHRRINASPQFIIRHSWRNRNVAPDSTNPLLEQSAPGSSHPMPS